MTAPEAHLIKFTHNRASAAGDVAKELACAKKLAAFFEPKGIKVGFLYFPAHQTIYGRDSGIEVSAETFNFLDEVYDSLRAANLRTINSKACLMRAKEHALVVQMHDTHLNANGYSAIADCLIASDLAELF